MTVDTNYKGAITEYGFAWGPAEVIRATSDPKHGVWLIVRGAKQQVQVRVTRSGLVRVGQPQDRRDGK